MGVSASTMLLLLLMLIPGNLNFHINRRHEDAKKNVKKMVPSCTDLLNMWHQMNRMTQHSLATNEIPVLPRNFLGLLLGIAHTYPEPPNKYQSRSHFKKVTNRQNTFEEDLLSPFVRPSQEREPDLLLKIGFSDPVDRLYEDQQEFLHQPKNKQNSINPGVNEKHGFHSPPLHPLVDDQTLQAQHIIPKLPQKFRNEPTKYERAFPLNEPSETSKLFRSFDDPFSDGFTSFSGAGDSPVATDVLPGSHTEKTGSFPDRQHKESLFTGFRETAPDTRLQDEVMDMFGTVLHDTEEEERWIQEGKQPQTFDPLPQWMVGGDLGSFGSFASDSDLSDDVETEDPAVQFPETTRPNTLQGSLGMSQAHLQHPYFGQFEKGAHRQFRETVVMQETRHCFSKLKSKVTCIERADRLCGSDLNCACAGWMTLKCVGGKCRRQEAFEVPEGFDLGTWHDGPLSLSELGMNRGRRRVMRNPWTQM